MTVEYFLLFTKSVELIFSVLLQNHNFNT